MWPHSEVPSNRWMYKSFTCRHFKAWKHMNTFQCQYQAEWSVWLLDQVDNLPHLHRWGLTLRINRNGLQSWHWVSAFWVRSDPETRAKCIRNLQLLVHYIPSVYWLSRNTKREVSLGWKRPVGGVWPVLIRTSWNNGQFLLLKLQYNVQVMFYIINEWK